MLFQATNRHHGFVWRLLFAGCAFAATGSAASAVPTLYVDDSAPAGGTGTSWASPMKQLQTALASAAAPSSGVTEIRVGQGIYHPDQTAANPSGTGDGLATFHLITGIALRGGYAGYGAANPDLRNVVAFESTLSHGAYVVTGTGTQPSAILDGFTITGGPGSGNGFTCTGGSPTINDCRFLDNVGTGPGAAVAVRGACHPGFFRCEFTGNSCDIGGAIDVRDGPNLALTDCTFSGNSAVGGGAIFAAGGPSGLAPVSITASGCRFVDNHAESGGGALFGCSAIVSLVNCTFAGNHSGFVGGGATLCNQGSVVNCVFSRNEATHGGGLDNLVPQLPIVNTSFSNNLGSAGTLGSAVLKNSILWGNSPSQVEVGNVTITFSDVQGGWPGAGNINADPLFVQPGSDELHLSTGSPCINTGSTAALPADILDLDGDGSTTEPIPFDLDGEDRVQDGIVDMGAYEGAGDPLPPQAIAEHLDPGESALLIPDGGLFDPLGSATSIVTSISGPPDSQFTVTQLSTNPHPAAGGFSELGLVLATTSTMFAGQFYMAVMIPIDPGSLNGADPLDLNATAFNSMTSDWALAVSGNTQPSPGHPGPIGDRIALEGTGPDWGLTAQLGDYGVFWNPSQQRGFVWANVDHLGDYALGLPIAVCVGDVSPAAGDGQVDEHDLRTVIASWGMAGGPADVNHDGVVDFLDIGQVIVAWGICPGSIAAVHEAELANWGPCPPGTRCVGDLDRNRTIDSLDLGILFANWGPCARCEADLNHDGVVNRADINRMLNSRR